MHRFSKYSALLLAILLLVTSSMIQAQTSKAAFDLSNLDKSVTPQTDFYQYSIGSWLKNNPIPNEYSRWGSFEMLAEENYVVLKKILENAAANVNAPQGTPEQKIGDFFATGMDSARIERDGYKPILPELKKVNDLRNMKDFESLIAEEHLGGVGALFGFYVTIDAKKSSVNVAHLSQGGLSLPDVEYYTKDDSRSKDIREKYVQHVTNMFKLIGLDEATAAQYAETVLKIETRLANASNTRLENRDPEKTYNKLTLNNLKLQSPGFNWDEYFDGLGVKTNLVVVGQPKFFAEVSKMVKEIPLDDWKVYLKWKIVDDAAPFLSSAFVNENFEFSGKYLTGAKVLQQRWKRVMQSVNFTMGELLGQLYVAEAFPPEAKERAVGIVNNLLKSMGESIKNLEWMGEATKEQALIKLGKFGVKIGYPDKWKDYSALEIRRDSYFKNILRASVWARKDNLAKLGKPVDKTEWGMSPQTVNAYYSPTRNEIVFPAAILQPPFFNRRADDAINYGAMGAVIGHEITHGFDDQGRKFDADGNIKDWWTKEDNDKFKVRAQKLIDEYNSFAMIDTFHVNGALTLGENIGDLGGLTVSLNAFKKTDQFKKNEKIDGFTPLQRFFLSWAQVWRNNARDETIKLRLKTDVHSPGKSRVNGPFMNIPEFWEAFDVKPGDPMRNSGEKLVKIW